MTALLTVPMVLAEESEKKTLDALVMIASYAEVIIAKALLGIVMVAVSATILLQITSLDIGQTGVDGAWTLRDGVIVDRRRLLMAGLFESTAQLNTLSRTSSFPFIIPAFIVGLQFQLARKTRHRFPHRCGDKGPAEQHLRCHPLPEQRPLLRHYARLGNPLLWPAPVATEPPAGVTSSEQVEQPVA